MISTSLLLFVSLLFLFTGIFWLKKLWAGALGGVLLLIAFKLSTAVSAILIYPLANAFFIWLELSLLLVGAYLFYALLQQKGQLNDFKAKMISGTEPIAIILLLCWFIGSFMEGIAGFGIPAMLVAPLLLSMGYKPLTATVLPLAANTTAVTFGALGTPLKIGFGICTVAPTVYYTVLFNCLPALLMPIVLASLFSKIEGVPLDLKKHGSTIMGASFCFLFPFAAGGLFSIEYPSVLAGGAGMVLFVSLFFKATQKPSRQLWGKTFWPYLLFVALLITAAFFFKNISWQWNPDTKRISAFQPGILFIIAGIFFLMLSKVKRPVHQFHTTLTSALRRLTPSLLTIGLLVVFTQLIRTDIIHFFEQYVPSGILSSLLLAPVAGVFGSFITGSATMSNLLLGDAIASQLPPVWVAAALALLNTGSAIGNAISLQNILMVKSVTAAPISEKLVMRWNAPVVGIYLLLVVLATVLYYFIVRPV